MRRWYTGSSASQSHYRKSLVFSWENLDNAAVAYGKLIARIVALPGEDGAVDMAAAAALQQKFRTAMDNDLNTSMAVTVLYDVLKARPPTPPSWRLWTASTRCWA